MKIKLVKIGNEWAQEKKFSIVDIRETLCRDDIADNYRCFLKSPLYAHTTTYANAQKILKEGLRVQPISKRVHQKFDQILKEECIRRGVYEKACEARSSNVFLFADFMGAMDHAIYMGKLHTIDMEEPVIFITNLKNREVKLDPENNRYQTLADINHIIHQNPDDYLAVTTKGNIPSKDIACLCRLNHSFFSKLSVPINIDDFYDDPYKYGFEFDAEKYGVNRDEDEEAYFNAYDRAIEIFIDNMDTKQKPHFGKYLQSLSPKNEYTREEEDFSDEINNINNWRCKCNTDKLRNW